MKLYKYRFFFYFLTTGLMANLSGLLDQFLHPDIAYFDTEHLIVGGTTALFTILLFGLLENCLKRTHHTPTIEDTPKEQIVMRYGWPLAAFWTIIVIASLAWNLKAWYSPTPEKAGICFLLEFVLVFLQEILFDNLLCRIKHPILSNAMSSVVFKFDGAVNGFG